MSKMTETTTRAIALDEMPRLLPAEEVSLTGMPSAATDEARRIWENAIANALTRAREEKILTTPGVLEGLDEAVAEIEAMEDSP